MKNPILFILLGILTIISLEAQVNEHLPSFPQAEGFGAYSLGGRGGKVIFVDNLNDEGPGSLRAAVMDPEPRIVIFRVSGTIELASNLVIRNPYLTIAGQTAPGDGICLKQFLLIIDNTHDIIVRGIRVRPGIESGLSGSNIDGIDVQNSHNVIIDHCTASWSCDEILNTNKNNRDITVQWCIFSESLDNSIHEKGAHGYAATIGGYRVSYHHNLFAHNNGRNPSIGGSDESITELLDFSNNVVFNWISRVCDGKPRTMNFVANYYKQGPATPENNEFVIAEIQASEKYGYTSRWYIDGNFVDNYPGITENNWDGGVRFGTGTSMEINREYIPFENGAYRTRDAEQAYLEVLDHAGVTVPRRDTVDKRVIGDVRNGSATFGNGIIDQVDQAGGWPTLLTYNVPLDTDEDGMPDDWEAMEGLNIHDPSDRYDIKEGEVYDNLERYLNELASDRPFLLPPINLEATLQGESEVKLHWEDITGDEAGFVVQRSDSENTFITLDTLDANVTTFIDSVEGHSRTVVYRVIAIGHALASIPSRPVIVNVVTALPVSALNKQLTILPNPFKEHFICLMESSLSQPVSIRIYNSVGLLVKEINDYPVQPGENKIIITMDKGSSGVYFLEYSPLSGTPGYLKIIAM